MDKSFLAALPQLGSECFTYENYESNWWSLLDIEYVKAMDVSRVMRAVSEFAVGYCDSSRVRLRPRSDSFAVMFERDGEQFWFHIQKWEFDCNNREEP